MAESIEPGRLCRVLADGGEYALLDVRGRGPYTGGHLFAAINLPLNQIEVRVRQYVPRLGTRVILCDAGEGIAERAAGVMKAAGYTDVSVLAGGVDGCSRAGFELFRGRYALPYAFGLYVNQVYRPPGITPGQLSAAINSNRPPLVIDTRTWKEFHESSVPAALNIPLGELTYRIRDAAPDSETPIVVTCGAVTRGILGGEILIEAGLDNPVSILNNGLRGWEYAGFDSEPGTRQIEPEVSDSAAAFSIEAAERVGAATGVRGIPIDVLDQWRADAGRTLYVVDVRTREEYEAGHLHDAVWIPGGELVGLHEDHIGTMNARFCLVDGGDGRATFAAAWLTRMGWPDVTVLEGGVQGRTLVPGRIPAAGLMDDEHATRRDDDAATIRAEQRRMLEWQGGLLGLLERDRVFGFPELPPVPSDKPSNGKSST